MARERELLLPNFQRGFEWAPRDQAALGASVLLGIPSGALLLLRGSVEEFSAKALGEKDALQASDITATACTFLLDGQQRLSSLRQVFGDPYRADWVSAHRKLYERLQYRWSLRLQPHAENRDGAEGDSDRDAGRFGVNHLSFRMPPLEPEVVTDWIEGHRVLKKHKKSPLWFHPAFMESAADQSSERALEIARHAAALHLIPLWGVATQDDGPLGEETQQAINLISMASYERLAARLRDGTLDGEVQAEIQLEARSFAASSTHDEAIKQALDMRLANWRSDFSNFLSATRDYIFPVVRVPQGEFAQAIVIFEAINRSGKPLSTFDLLGARYAKRSPDKKSLASQIVDYVEQLDDERRTKSTTSAWSRPNGLMISNQELTSRFKTYFHQGLTLREALGDFSENRIAELRVDDVKKEAALDLDENQISEYWQPVTLAIYESWAFLQERCSVPTEASLRNKLLMIPLVAAHLIPAKRRPRGLTDYLTYWFWASTLTSRYSSDQNPRCIDDTKRLLSWVLGQSKGNPFESLHNKVLEDEGYSDLDTLLGDGDDDTGTNVGDYLPMFVSSQGGHDLLTSKPLRSWEEQLDLHHIIPLGSVTKLGQTARELRRSDDAFGRLMNSPLNLCYLSKDSNEKIKAMPLTRYQEVLTDATLHSLRLPLNRDDYAKGASADGSDDAWVKEVLRRRHENIKAAWLDLASRLEPNFERNSK